MQLRIGTRKSPLALAQAEEVRRSLAEAWPELALEVVPMATTGDKVTDRPLADIGGKGLFTKELEEALLERRIDIAVHSAKDMQTLLPDGLMIGCMPEREDPRDMLIGPGIRSLEDVPQGATLGTSSLRRTAQMLMRRPDLKIVPMRGNVQTRLDKLAQGQARATMLARAGLNRLGLYDIEGTTLAADDFLPAVAQGALGIECREGDVKTLELLSPLADFDTENAVHCERAFLRALDGSCRTPIAGYAIITPSPCRGEGWGGGEFVSVSRKETPSLTLPPTGGGDIMFIHFRGLIVRPDGSAHHAVEISGPCEDAERLGDAAGRELLAKAGKNFL